MSWTDILASSAATSLAEITTIPLCTIKTNYQTDLKYRSIIDTAKDIHKTRGLSGFYTASFSAVFAQIVATASKFTFYSYFKKIRKTKQGDIKNNILNGAAGGIIASVFSHPFDVIKVHQQNNIRFLSELRVTGPKLLYRGYSKSLTKNIMVTSLLFPFYDFYNSKLNNTWLASSCASLTVTTILHPVDYLKVRHISNQKLYFNFTNLKDNMKYYYRGLHINLMRVTPHFMITMAITEKIKEHYTLSNVDK